MRINEITCAIHASTGLNEVRLAHHIYLASLDPSFLFHFSKQCLVGNIQGKFQKNRSSTFVYEESPFSFPEPSFLLVTWSANTNKTSSSGDENEESHFPSIVLRIPTAHNFTRD